MLIKAAIRPQSSRRTRPSSAARDRKTNRPADARSDRRQPDVIYKNSDMHKSEFDSSYVKTN
jgi:hypothetical protein